MQKVSRLDLASVGLPFQGRLGSSKPGVLLRVLAVTLLGAAALHGQAKPYLIISKARLSFTFPGTTSAPQSINITNIGGGTLSWTASTDVNWLSLSATSGTAPSTLVAAVSPEGMPTGSYLGRLTISAPGALAAPATIIVTLSISGPQLQLQSKYLKIAVPAGGQGSTWLDVSNAGGGALRWSATSNAPWIKLPVASGVAPHSLEVVADMAGYKPGTYTGTFSISAPGAAGAPALINLQAAVAPAPVGVSINAPPASVTSGSRTQLTAVVSGTTNQQVLWTTSGGSINSTGQFFAPAVSDATAVTITARSAADATAFATTQITVVPASDQPAVFQEVGGQVVVEAEHGTIVNQSAAWVFRTQQPGFSGAGYLAAEPDLGVTLASNYIGVAPEVRFSVEFGQPGTYNVWIRGLGPDVKGDSLHAGLDGQRVLTAEAVSEFPLASPLAWGWSSWVMDRLYRATLQISAAGVHTINVWMREDGFLFDKILLTRDANYTPTDLGPAESPYVGTLPSPTPGPVTPVLSVSSNSLSFAATAGRPDPPVQVVNVSTGITQAAWSASSTQSWLVVSPSGGTGSGSLQASVSSASLEQGSYSGSITVMSPGSSGSPRTIAVTLVVQAASTLPALNINPSQLGFSMLSDGAVPARQSVSISNSSGSPLAWSAVEDKSWIVLSAVSGSMPGVLEIGINPAGLAPGSYSGNVQISASGVTGSPATIRIALSIVSGDSAGNGREFYAAPGGSALGDGSISHPWNLVTALSHPAAVKPGDTIWLRGGKYVGNFTSKLKGEPGKPIIVRQFPGERATIDTSTIATSSGLLAQGSDTWFWGFEIMSSYPNRRTGQAGSFAAPSRVDGVDTYGPRNKFINLVVHDTAQGFGFWTPAVDNEIYGCLIYYNGWSGPDRGHGHSIYAQNLNGVKVIEDTVNFYGFGMGPHIYGSGAAYAKHFRILGNVSFNNGYLHGGPAAHWSNYLVTVGSGTEDIVFDNNHSYHNTNEDGYSQLGWEWSGVEKDLLARNNYFIGGEAAVQVWNWSQLTFTGNTIYARNPKTDFMMIFNHRGDQYKNAYQFDQNKYYGSGLLRYLGTNTLWSNWQKVTGVDRNSTYTAGRPTGTWTFVRPNKYEPGRANLIAYNWGLQPQVSFDVSGVLQPGQSYEVRDVMNFYGPPVASGVYASAPITVPMVGLTIDPPVGNVFYQPVHTAPEFGTFVLMGK